MEAKEILQVLNNYKPTSLYGRGAKMFMDNPEQANQYLSEIYDQIKTVPEHADRTFGPAVLLIIEYFKTNQ